MKVFHNDDLSLMKLKLGNITIEALNDLNNNKEYSIRPTINSNCWNELIKFQILENDF